MKMTHEDAKRIGKIILGIFESDGWVLKVEKTNYILIENKDEEDIYEEYKNWFEFLECWKESVELDVENKLYYLNAEDYAMMGIDVVFEC